MGPILVNVWVSFHFPSSTSLQKNNLEYPPPGSYCTWIANQCTKSEWTNALWEPRNNRPQAKVAGTKKGAMPLQLIKSLSSYVVLPALPASQHCQNIKVTIACQVYWMKRFTNWIWWRLWQGWWYERGIGVVQEDITSYMSNYMFLQHTSVKFFTAYMWPSTTKETWCLLLRKLRFVHYLKDELTSFPMIPNS